MGLFLIKKLFFKKYINMFTLLNNLRVQINLEFSMKMKKFVLLTAVFALLVSCGSKDKGQLVGAKGKKWQYMYYVN